MSRLNTGKLALSRTAVRAAPVVRRITEAVREELRSKNIKLSSKIPPLVIYADAVRVEQIVWNLVSNAVKFTPNGGQIVVRLCEAECARLQVSDTGRAGWKYAGIGRNSVRAARPPGGR